MSREELSSGEVLQIFKVHDHINQNTSSFQVMLPSPKGFVNGQEFLVMSIVVQFGGVQSLGVKHDQMNRSIWKHNGKDCHDSIV